MRSLCLALGLTLCGAATADTVSRLYAVADLSPSARAQLKASGEGRWWAELGEHFLSTAPREALDALDAKALREWPALDPDTLVLEPRGCGFEPGKHLPELAMAGRFALLRVPPSVKRQSMARLGWQAFQVDTVYARQIEGGGNKGAGADPLVQPVVDAVQAARWRQSFTDLAGFNRNTFGSGRIAARDWIAAQFTAIPGIASVATPSFQFNFAAQSYSAENVLATMPGTRLPDQWVIVGGHYDSRNTNGGPGDVNPSPGAEDNATGCAGVIEMARVLSRFPPQRTVLFMCYAGEEQGLFGSAAHAQQLLQSGNASRVQMMLNMDMIGYSGDSQLDVLLEGNNSVSTQMNRLAALGAIYAPTLSFSISTQPCCSDHQPYLSAGMPAILTIANDWSSYPHYHRSTDTPANVSNALAMGGAILRMNAAYLSELAGANDRVFGDGAE